MSLPSGSPRFAVVKVVFGLMLAWAGGTVLVQQGYGGAPATVVSGLILAFGIKVVLVNVARLASREVSRRVSYDVALGVTMAAIILGPSLSAAWYQAEEPSQWSAVESTSDDLGPWDRYFAAVPEPFRRADAMPRYYLAQAIVHGGNQDAPRLRTPLGEIATRYPTEKTFVPAQDEASAALRRMYQGALDRLAGQTGADPKLQEVFARILDDLATRADAAVHLVFSNAADMSDPPGHQRAVMDLRRAPKIAAAFPRGDAPVLDVGDAFSPSYDLQRRNTFVAAAQSAFGAVFAEGLLEIVPLADTEDPRGKWILLVESRIARTPDLYSHSRDETILGLLSGLVVNWRFLIVDRSGQELYTLRTRSIPAENLSWRTASGDPPWSPYSIMMDSAYYNYARQIIARFGMEPPPERQSFSFTQAAAPRLASAGR